MVAVVTWLVTSPTAAGSECSVLCFAVVVVLVVVVVLNLVKCSVV